MKVRHRVISLLSESKRRNDISKDFDSEGINFIFFDAINGHKLKVTQYETSERQTYNRKLTSGEIGCYLSHVSVITDFLKSEDDYLIVYEDDVSLCRGYGNKLKVALNNLDYHSLDILLLGYRNEYVSIWGAMVCGKVKLKRFCDYGWGAHSYLITKLAAKKIVDDFSEPLIPFDCITGGYSNRYIDLKNNYFKIFAYPEKIVTLNEENSEVSTIEGRAQKRNFIKSKFLKYIVQLIKTIKPIKRYYHE